MIEKYMEDNLKKGHSMTQIKGALIAAGYTRDQIDKAEKNISKKNITDIAIYINKKIEQGMNPGAVKNYLLALGHSHDIIDHAINKIVNAKKYELRKKQIQKTKEQIKAVKGNIISKFKGAWKGLVNITVPNWNKYDLWVKVAFIPAAITLIILVFWELIMIIKSIGISGNLNCYSFGAIITCSFFESLLYYFLMLLFFVLVSGIVFGVFGGIGKLIEKWNFKR